MKKREKEKIKSLRRNHTFVICAYKESKYLEECIKSVLEQEVKTKVILSTSTPNKYIKNLCDKYKIKYYIRKGKSDIRDDWNYAYNLAKTELVTLAHQDDVYEKDYTKNILLNYEKDANIYVGNYKVIKNNAVMSDRNSKIKKILKFPLRFSILSGIKLFKVGVLAFGNSINCPSVTYNKKRLGENIFTSKLKFSIDWETFLKIAKIKGKTKYINKDLIKYRVHEEAETMEFTKSNRRMEEDIYMFNEFWPSFITNLIMKVYVKSYTLYLK